MTFWTPKKHLLFQPYEITTVPCEDRHADWFGLNQNCLAATIDTLRKSTRKCQKTGFSQIISQQVANTCPFFSCQGFLLQKFPTPVSSPVREKTVWHHLGKKDASIIWSNQCTNNYIARKNGILRKCMCIDMYIYTPMYIHMYMYIDICLHIYIHRAPQKCFALSWLTKHGK